MAALQAQPPDEAGQSRNSAILHVRIAKCSSQQKDPKQASAEKHDCADRKVYAQVVLPWRSDFGRSDVVVDDGKCPLLGH